jgi:RND family efflux transporter MFP subunit
MRKPLTLLPGAAFLLFVCVGITGCNRAPANPVAATPTIVTVAHPIQREVIESGEFTSRTAAVESVQVRARVTGYLDKINFAEGAEVKADEVLYEIDPRPYKAVFDQAKGNLEVFEARLKRQDADLARARNLLSTGALAREDYDKALGDRGETAASIAAQHATIARAKLDLDFTKVLAPVAGRVSRTQITKGNLVKADDTVLTTLVSLDPMYAYFDVDENTVLRVQQLIREGKAKSARDVKINVTLRLANGFDYPEPGPIDFVDNQVDPKTGTLRLRGVFPNPKRVLTPGLFGRVRVPIGYAHPAILIADRALSTDQGQRIVFVIDSKNEVARRPVEIGSVHDGLRVIESGLTLEDRVIVDGVQSVKPGAIVQPKTIEMAPPKKE